MRQILIAVIVLMLPSLLCSCATNSFRKQQELIVQAYQEGKISQADAIQLINQIESNRIQAIGVLSDSMAQQNYIPKTTTTRGTITPDLMGGYRYKEESTSY